MSKPASDKQKAVLTKAGYSSAELEGLSVTKASTLIDYVSHNNWTRPNVSEVEAIVAGELLEEEKATQPAIIMARVPTSTEVEEFTKDMRPEQGFLIEEAIDDLREAVKKGEEALIEQGRALAVLKAACRYGQWSKLLLLLGVPRVTAHRQIQLAKAHDVRNPKLRKMLESRGVKFCPTMTARELQLAQKAAEVAKNAEAEAVQLFHGETTGIESGEFADLWEDSQRQRRIDAVVEEKVEAFLDTQLQPKLLPGQATDSTQRLRNPPIPQYSAKAIARLIATVVMDRFNWMDPSLSRTEVWKLVVEIVEAEADVRVKKLEVASARI